MKKIIVILSCSLILAACSDISIEMPVEGKVQSITEEVFMATGTATDPVKGDVFIETIYAFNNEGQITQENKTETLNHGSKRVTNILYVYDKDGLLLNKDISGTSYYRISCEYDENNNRIREQKLVGGTLSEKDEYFTMEYDAKGTMLKRSQFNKHNILQRYFTYEYDKKGNVIDEKEYNSSDALQNTMKNTYDSKNNPLTRNVFGMGGAQTEKLEFTYTYDKKGNFTKVVVVNIDDLIEVGERSITYY